MKHPNRKILVNVGGHLYDRQKKSYLSVSVLKLSTQRDVVNCHWCGRNIFDIGCDTYYVQESGDDKLYCTECVEVVSDIFGYIAAAKTFRKFILEFFVEYELPGLEGLGTQEICEAFGGDLEALTKLIRLSTEACLLTRSVVSVDTNIKELLGTKGIQIDHS